MDRTCQRLVWLGFVASQPGNLKGPSPVSDQHIPPLYGGGRILLLVLGVRSVLSS